MQHKYLAPGKLNLGLKIVGKKVDGYHLLKTIFCLIDLFDEIIIEVTLNTNDIKLCNHSYQWSIQDDLAYKAAKLLQKHTNIQYGASITVKKKIPSGSGMGGGSSDAATVLLALNKLWNINLSKDELINLGMKLGADVPFFIYGKNAFAEGVGEILSSITIPKSFFVLVIPNFGISTKDIFTNFTFNNNKIDPNDITTEYLLTTLENDLEPIARKLNSQLNHIFTELKKYGNPVMTGSGSTIYLRYDDINTAKKVAHELETKYNSFLVRGL